MFFSYFSFNARNSSFPECRWLFFLKGDNVGKANLIIFIFPFIFWCKTASRPFWDASQWRIKGWVKCKFEIISVNFKQFITLFRTLMKNFPNYGSLRINTSIFWLWSNKYVIQRFHYPEKIFYISTIITKEKKVETIVCQWFLVES